MKYTYENTLYKTLGGIALKMEEYKLWKNTPGKCEEIPVIKVYIPENKKSDGAVVILPGGGYALRSAHEGDGYAKYLNSMGITAFVCEYRVYPHLFPLPLLDSRRAVKYVRYNAKKYGIDKNKVFIMGSSAGGHLAALTCTYREKIDFEGMDEIDNEDFMPNGQILCYPVIKLSGDGITHIGSGKSLLGENYADLQQSLSPDLIADKKTPRAFIWHTFDDKSVNVINTLDYAKRLRIMNIETEIHIFPHGHHGLGLAEGEPHVALWADMLKKWFEYIDF